MLLRRFVFVAIGLSVVLCAAVSALGQSSDQALPTPVLSNEITGTIDPLDLGDPRLTRHYYAFDGTPGDVLITVDSNNLNGDVDIFTAVTFRPLAKATMYANVQSQAITKDIYLKTRQIMILRIEARTPNDDPGTYHIRFSGSFAQFSGGIPVATESATATPSEKPGNNRLTSVGATIPRPPTEPVETVKTEPTPEKTPEPTTAKPTEKPASSTKRTTTRRGSRPAPARSTPAKKTESTTAKTDSSKSSPTPAEKSTNPKTSSPTEPQVVQPAGPHLIIEQKDGTRIDRPMATVRRVIVEGPTIVVVLKSGQIQRIPMASVVRMAIEPEP